MSRANTIIDYLDALDGAGSNLDAWRATAATGERLGASYVAMGLLNVASRAPEWAYFSFSDRLMADYVAADVHLDDPGVAHCLAGSPGWEWRTDGADPLPNPVHRRALRLMHEAGHGRVVGLPSPIGPGGRQPLFVYGEHRGDRGVEAAGGPELMRVISALAMARIGRPEAATPYALLARPPLSPREKDVLRRLACGELYARIAERLGVSEATVRMHVRHARAKLGAASREQALATALISGELDL